MITGRIQPPEMIFDGIGKQVKRLVISEVKCAENVFNPLDTKITDKRIVNDQVGIIPIG
jgi:hypothetical protein